MFDAASTILAQRLSQIKGVGQVVVGGGSLPSVRIELNPTALNRYGIGLEDVRGTLNSANANIPKGHFSNGRLMWEVGASDQLLKASEYAPLIVAYRNGAPVRIADVGRRSIPWKICALPDISTASLRCCVIIFRQPGANIIDTVDRIRAILPQLQAEIPRRSISP